MSFDALVADNIKRIREYVAQAEDLTDDIPSDEYRRPLIANPEKDREEELEAYRREANAKGGHIAQILKKVGLAKTPNSRVLSQALMALDTDDLVRVKQAVVDQAAKVAKRRERQQMSQSTDIDRLRILENALRSLEM